ncbi:MAG TPA: enolase C-terminal domain-like protein [Acidobacteriota bacterium]|jgi:muconate cycloisomerase
MKITRIESIPVQVPIKQELMIRASRGSHSISPFLLVRIHTDEGVTGLGEVSCTPAWSGEDHTSAAHFIHYYFEPLLHHEDPTEIEPLCQKINRKVAGNYFTKAAVEMALWDIEGKHRGLPLYRLWGGPAREFIPLKFSVSGVEPAQAAKIATWALHQGFRALKVKVGIDADQDVARVKAVRSVVGREVKIGVDANGKWSSQEAVEMIKRLAAHDIFFVEQPVPARDLFGMADVRRRSGIPIIADESLYSLEDAANLAQAQAADVLSIYVGKAGGLGPARTIADFARSAGLRATVGSNLEMGIGSAAMIHLAMSTLAITAEDFPCDIIGPLYYTDDLLAEPLRIRDGEARPGAGPGLGVELDEAKVDRYRV